jgi:hypothetical protein
LLKEKAGLLERPAALFFFGEIERYRSRVMNGANDGLWLPLEIRNAVIQEILYLLYDNSLLP